MYGNAECGEMSFRFGAGSSSNSERVRDKSLDGCDYMRASGFGIFLEFSLFNMSTRNIKERMADDKIVAS